MSAMYRGFWIPPVFDPFGSNITDPQPNPASTPNGDDYEPNPNPKSNSNSPNPTLTPTLAPTQLRPQLQPQPDFNLKKRLMKFMMNQIF